MKYQHPTLFDERSLNPVTEIKRAMNKTARDSGLSRPQLVDLLNDLISLESLRTKGKKGQVTEAVLAKWLAVEEKDQVIPLKLLPAFCKVVKNLAPLQALAGILGAMVIDAADQVLLDMAKAQCEEKEAAQRRRRLEAHYKEFKR